MWGRMVDGRGWSSTPPAATRVRARRAVMVRCVTRGWTASAGAQLTVAAVRAGSLATGLRLATSSVQWRRIGMHTMQWP